MAIVTPGSRAGGRCPASGRWGRAPRIPCATARPPPTRLPASPRNNSGRRSRQQVSRKATGPLRNSGGSYQRPMTTRASGDRSSKRSTADRRTSGEMPSAPAQRYTSSITVAGAASRSAANAELEQASTPFVVPFSSPRSRAMSSPNAASAATAPMTSSAAMAARRRDRFRGAGSRLPAAGGSAGASGCGTADASGGAGAACAALPAASARIVPPDELSCSGGRRKPPADAASGGSNMSSGQTASPFAPPSKAISRLSNSSRQPTTAGPSATAAPEPAGEESNGPISVRAACQPSAPRYLPS